LLGRFINALVTNRVNITSISSISLARDVNGNIIQNRWDLPSSADDDDEVVVVADVAIEAAIILVANELTNNTYSTVRSNSTQSAGIHTIDVERLIHTE
jgi:hypothetical protein